MQINLPSPNGDLWKFLFTQFWFYIDSKCKNISEVTEKMAMDRVAFKVLFYFTKPSTPWTLKKRTLNTKTNKETIIKPIHVMTSVTTQSW